ncbi:MAG TPA: ATP-binding protein [Micavibrio sp.]|jgi:PAS domain S-box-containing protein
MKVTPVGKLLKSLTRVTPDAPEAIAFLTALVLLITGLLQVRHDISGVAMGVGAIAAGSFLAIRHFLLRREMNLMAGGIQSLYELAAGDEPGIAKIPPHERARQLDVVVVTLSQHDKSYKTLLSYKEQVQQERDFYTHILNETPSLVVWLNPDGTVKYCNPALSRSTGYTMQEILGKKWFDVFYPKGKDDPEFEKLNQLSFHGQQSIRDHVTTLRAKNGENRYISWTTANILDEDGNPVELIGLGNDITEERKRAATETEEQKMKALAGLAGGLAHEISNALQPILGLSEICAMQVAGKDKKLEECMQIIQRNALHCRNIVNSVLSFARRETKKKKLHNLPEVLTETLSFTDEFLPMDVQVVCKGFNSDPATLHNQDIYANIDRTELVQIMANLFTNASHAMKRAGIIEVTLAEVLIDGVTTKLDNMPNGKYAVIAVKDHGHGMDEDVQKSLFQPFFTTKTVGEGTGLGLAAVYGIIKDWNGTVKVQSKLGEGSTFFLYIPVADHPSRMESLSDRIVEKDGYSENGKYTRH